MENIRIERCAACELEMPINKTNVCDPCHAVFADAKGKPGLAANRIVREGYLYCLRCFYVAKVTRTHRKNGNVNAYCNGCSNSKSTKRKFDWNAQAIEVERKIAIERAREAARADRHVFSLELQHQLEQLELNVIQYGSMMEMPHLLEHLGVSVPAPPIPVYQPMYYPPTFAPALIESPTYEGIPMQLSPTPERRVGVNITITMPDYTDDEWTRASTYCRRLNNDMPYAINDF